jgi:mono/diheme cytochrome c family protein
MANSRLDLVAFGDAIKTSILDEKRLTPAAVSSTYRSKYGKALSPADVLLIGVWLQGARAQLQAALPLRGLPYSGAELRNATFLTGGPGRNQPMRETVRFLIDQTPLPDGGASKIPSLYHQDRRAWGQYDGSLHNPLTRNALAALGVGASIYNLRVPGILGTMGNSYAFIAKLDGPKYADVFKGYARPINAQSAERGRAVYERSCLACHGAPGPQSGEWTTGKRQDEVISTTELGTDPSRVSFRFYPQMADLIYAFFPDGHPLKPKRNELRPNPGDVHGYVAHPIESVFSRAPYLHNGSVMTLAELINLKPRRPLMYRGANLYDPTDVGLLATDRPDAERYFRYDTRAYGNSNRGHDYPWAYKGPGWNQQQLTDLLEYLKTL